MAYEGESESLVSQGKVSEARDKLEHALTVARQNQKLGHETMILQRWENSRFAREIAR